MLDKSDVLARVCQAVDSNQLGEASSLLANDYPFTPLANVGRRYTPLQCMHIFVRDGFIDRYSGQRLVFPGTLRLLSMLFPLQFPFHSNWKTDACHFAFYELYPTIDHLVPVSRSGVDSDENWLSTSMLRNAAKANFTIEELGWKIHPAGEIRQWDGLTGWFLRQKLAPELQANSYLQRWRVAAVGCLTNAALN